VDLLAAFRTDPELIGALYERHADAVYRFLSRRAGPNAAEDLASEVFVAALGARKRVFPHKSGSALPWLYGIASNVLRAHLRQANRLGRGQSEMGVDWEAVDARLDAQALRSQLREVIGVLSAKERDILLLVAWDGLTVTEAADVLGLVASHSPGEEPSRRIAGWLRRLSVTTHRLRVGDAPWEPNIFGLPQFSDVGEELLVACLDGRETPTSADQRTFLDRVRSLPALAPLFQG